MEYGKDEALKILDTLLEDERITPEVYDFIVTSDLLQKPDALGCIRPVTIDGEPREEFYLYTKDEHCIPQSIRSALNRRRFIARGKRAIMKFVGQLLVDRRISLAQYDGLLAAKTINEPTVFANILVVNDHEEVVIMADVGDALFTVLKPPIPVKES